jgi:HupE / UreJ protein
VSQLSFVVINEMLFKLGYRVTFLLLAAAALTSTATAHDFYTSYSRIQVNGSRVEVEFPVNLKDFSDTDAIKAIQANYQLGGPEAPSSVAVSSDALAENIVLLKFVYSFDHDVTKMKITSTLHRITQADHTHIVQIGEGDNTREAVLNATNPSVEIDLQEKTILAAVFDFARLGIEHIFTGYDHLAFLVGLLITTRTLGSLLKVTTSFTAAHSITLALATFGVVSVPSRVIESLIALSIAYIAIENFTGKTLMQRWKITFLFGLIHGFGFSNVLKEMALSRRTLAISLFSFNGGVELGQLVFVCVVFPLVYYLAMSRWKVHFLSASSIAIAVLGVFWFVQRAFLAG